MIVRTFRAEDEDSKVTYLQDLLGVQASSPANKPAALTMKFRQDQLNILQATSEKDAAEAWV